MMTLLSEYLLESAFWSLMGLIIGVIFGLLIWGEKYDGSS